MLKNLLRHLGTKPHASWYSAFAVTTGIFIVSTSFMNCSKAGFTAASSLDDMPISTSCGKSKKMSQEEMFKLIHEHHKPMADQRVRCPGFFAEIDAPPEEATGQEKITMPVAARQKQISEANNCNIDGPPDDNTTPGERPPTPTKEDRIKELVAKTSSSNILQTMTTLSDGTLGPTRYVASNSARRAPEWIRDQFTKIANGRTDIKIRLVEHAKINQPSVEAIIEGTGPDKNKFVIIGGHEDSIHGTNSRSFVDSPAPGADDNASGVATVMETYRVLVESGYKPEVSIAFYTYAGEEIGLVGSQEIARSYADAGKEVLGAIQLDMTSYSSGATEELTFITDYTSPTLTTTAAELATKYMGMKVSYDTCGYACSDHASWSRYNFRSVFPVEKEFWASVNRIHTIQDKVDALAKPTYAEKFAKLCVAFALTLGFN